MQKVNDKYDNCGGKEKAAEYYIENKEVIKEKTNNKYKTFSEEGKESQREYERNRYRMTKK